ncbi:potassium efflux system KefA protein [Desulfocucumis palustris]|uniref:Potassium efflux system KefA protein n=1 Tax=Desulfocucumis palustris TaxID=1898651 RepID=A0A2L2XCU0_9FIRM|nr:mechanosensitive ion channel domain-containing protein [Desulfocucumis palustris]GBF34045.1 potassium efflux system KefA protein [Desulfocucumis palustris]
MYRQYFEFYGIILAYFLASLLLAWLAGKLWGKITGFISSRTRSELDEKLVEMSCRPVKYVAFFLLMLAGKSIAVEYPVFQNSKFLGRAEQIAYALLVVVVAWWAVKLVEAVIAWYMDRSLGEQEQGNPVEQHVAMIARQVIKFVVYFVALTIILSYFKISISGLVATAGVASLAVALAAQETLGNMLSGVMIIFDKPFRVGDRIETNGLIGDVMDIGPRSTRIRTFDNTVMVVPNKDLASSRIINHVFPNPQVTIRLKIGVAYGTDLKQVKELLLGIMGSHPDVLGDPGPAVYFTEFGESSLNLLATCSIADYKEKFRVLDELNMSVKEQFEATGIEIPFPQRDVNLYYAGEMAEAGGAAAGGTERLLPGRG